jgi:HMG box factor
MGMLLHPTPTSFLPPSSYSGGGGTHGKGRGATAVGSVGGANVNVNVKRKQERDALRAQTRSVEAMVMSISFVNKLRVLERISPPLAAVGDGSGGAATSRGPVIAIEGPDARLLGAVAGVVERALRAAAPAERDGGWEVRCWEDQPSLRLGWRFRSQERRGSWNGDGDGDARMSSDPSSRQGSLASVTSSAGGPAASGPINPFTAYLATITDWHAKSAEIAAFVTDTSVSSPATPSSARLSASSASSVSSASTDTNKTKADPEEEEDTTPRAPHYPLPSRSHSDSPHPHQPTQTQTQTQRGNQQQKQKLPIALLPSGFALTLSDRFACAVPIVDAYAPVDHWQWMATLWRGIVGADLVVYVVPKLVPFSSSSSLSASGAGAGAGAGAGGSGAGGEEGSSSLEGGTVEVRSAGLIVVRVPVLVPQQQQFGLVGGVSAGHGEDSVVAGGRDRETVVVGVDEKVQRRLGFELVEWVRSQGWVSAGRAGDAMEY